MNADDIQEAGKNRIAAFFDGLTRTTTEPVQVPDPLIGSNATLNGMEDYASLDMVEASTSYDEGDNPADREAEPIRTLDGALDFLGRVGEGALHEAATILDEITTQPDFTPKEKPFFFHTVQPGSPSWKSTVYAVNAPSQVLRKNANRRLARFLNTGSEVIYLRADSATPVAGNGPNVWPIPISKLDGTAPYTPVEIPLTDEVWAFPTTPGTTSTLYVMEVWGEPSQNQVL